jgi:hypothetical protein
MQKKKKKKWKKGARAIINPSVMGPSVGTRVLRGKRILSGDEEHGLTDEGAPHLKKARSNGGVVIHESGSVEVVE